MLKIKNEVEKILQEKDFFAIVPELKKKGYKAEHLDTQIIKATDENNDGVAIAPLSVVEEPENEDMVINDTHIIGYFND